MTKNRFLSKRLAYLLTTSLITLCSVQNSANAQVTIAADTTRTTSSTAGFNFTADAVLTLNTAASTSGAITTATADEGSVVVNTETTFTGNIGATRNIRVFTVNDGAIATIAGTINTQELIVNGSLILGTNANGGAALDVINLGATGVTALGRDILNTETVITAVTNSVTHNAAHKIHMPVNLTDGQSVKLFVGATEAAANVQTMLEDNALFTYVATLTNTNDTTVTSTARTSSEVATQLGVNSNKSVAFIQAHAAAVAAFALGGEGSIDSGLDSFEIALFPTFSSENEASNFAKQVAPQTDTITGSTIAAKAVTSGVQNVIATRLASLRSGDAYSTGVVTGSGMSANSGFIQAFGSTVEQKSKGDESGYDADTTGFAVGFDGKIDGGAVIGISYARSEADVNGKGSGRAKNDIKTDSISLYADYATKGGYVEGSITYGKSDNKGSRIINTAETNTTFRSDYDGEQYSFRLFGGIPQSLGGGAFFTPFAGATISQIKADAYTETSTVENDPLRLTVAQDTVDSQVGTIGIKYHQAIKDGKTTFTPEVKLAVNQEFGDGNITTTNTYQGGGASFKNSTAIERTSATAGVGLNISSDNVSFNIGYEADVREKYLGHSAQAKITAKF
jgi:uncharacterized protein with beta-barrel porin domain